MKQIIISLLTLLLLYSNTAFAQKSKDCLIDEMGYVLEVKNASVENIDNKLVVALDLLARQDVPGRQSVVLVPYVMDTITFKTVAYPEIWLNSRNQQIYYQREKRRFNSEILVFRKKKGVNLSISYLKSVPYEEWMERAVVRLAVKSCGCNIMKERGNSVLCKVGKDAEPVINLFPVFQFPTPEKVKVREESGSANLCFVVNKTDIRPDYMDNPAQLKKIEKTIEFVKNDTNVVIQSMTIRGYASPEGPLEKNIKLSQERTEALKEYIHKSGMLRKNINIAASSGGENWSGFKKYVQANMNIPQRAKILEIINSSADEDKKERRMRTEAKEGFIYCVNNGFPALRCTDYAVKFIVRPFSLEESEAIFETRPGNLSLNEIYILADKYKNNEEKYNAIMRKTFMLYPDDHYANLTMSYIALKHKMAEEAEQYLKKVKPCAEKTLNLAILEYLKGDVEKAKSLANEAKNAGLKEAEEQLKEFQKIVKSEK